MKHTRSLEGLCHAAVTVTLLLTFSVRSWGQTRLYNGPVGSPAANEAAGARGGPAQPAACRDATPHKVTFVEVEPGVQRGAGLGRRAHAPDHGAAHRAG